MIIVRPNHTQFTLIPFRKFWATEIREEEKINGIDYCIVMCFLKRLRAKYAHSACEITIIIIVFDHSEHSRRPASCDLGLRSSALVAPMGGGCRPYLRRQPQSIETNTDLKKYPHTQPADGVVMRSPNNTCEISSFSSSRQIENEKESSE